MDGLQTPRRHVSLEEKINKIADKITGSDRVISTSERNRIDHQNQMQRSCIESKSIPLFSCFSKDNPSYILTASFDKQIGRRDDDPHFKMFKAIANIPDAFVLPEREVKRKVLLDEIESLITKKNVKISFDEALPRISPRHTKLLSTPLVNSGHHETDTTDKKRHEVDIPPTVITPRVLDTKTRIEDRLRANEDEFSDTKIVDKNVKAPEIEEQKTKQVERKPENVERRQSTAIPVIIGGSDIVSDVAVDQILRVPKPPRHTSTEKRRRKLKIARMGNKDIHDDTIESQDGIYEGIPLCSEEGGSNNESGSDSETDVANIKRKNPQKPTTENVKLFHLKGGTKVTPRNKISKEDLNSTTTSTFEKLSSEKPSASNVLGSGINIEIPTVIIPAPHRGALFTSEPKHSPRETHRKESPSAPADNWCLVPSKNEVSRENTVAAVSSALHTPRGLRDLFVGPPGSGGHTISQTPNSINTRPASFYQSGASFSNLKRAPPSFAGFGGCTLRKSSTIHGISNSHATFRDDEINSNLDVECSGPIDCALTHVIPPVIFKGLTSSGATSQQIRRKRTMTVVYENTSSEPTAFNSMLIKASTPGGRGKAADGGLSSRL